MGRAETIAGVALCFAGDRCALQAQPDVLGDACTPNNDVLEIITYLSLLVASKLCCLEALVASRSVRG